MAMDMILRNTNMETRTHLLLLIQTPMKNFNRILETLEECMECMEDLIQHLIHLQFRHPLIIFTRSIKHKIMEDILSRSSMVIMEANSYT